MSNDDTPILSHEQKEAAYGDQVKYHTDRVSADPMFPDGPSKAAEVARRVADANKFIGHEVPKPGEPNRADYGMLPPGVAPRVKHDANYLKAAGDNASSYDAEFVQMGTVLGINSESLTYLAEEIERTAPAVKAMSPELQKEHWIKGEDACLRFFGSEEKYAAAKNIAKTYLESAGTPLSMMLAGSKVVTANVQLLVQLGNMYELKAAYNRAKNPK